MRFTTVFLSLVALVASSPISPSNNNETVDLEKRNSGQATVFDAGLGACGNYNSGSDYIVAVSASLYDSLGGSSVCGRSITAHLDGRSVTVTVEDRCGGCAYGDLDFSTAAWNTLTGNKSPDRFDGLTWEFN